MQLEQYGITSGCGCVIRIILSIVARYFPGVRFVLTVTLPLLQPYIAHNTVFMICLLFERDY